MGHTDIIPEVAKPDHVPYEHVYDFDYSHGLEFQTDPFAYAAKIIAEAPPVFWTPRNGGHWLITGFNAVLKAARDWETFSSVIMSKEMLAMLQTSFPPGSITPAEYLPAGVDPPAHSRYRTPINPAFSPKVAFGMKEKIRDLAVSLIEGVRPKGQCELLSEIAEPLPAQMFLKLYGLPLEKQEEYRAIVKRVMSSPLHDLQAMIQNTQLLVSAYTGTMIERRDAPRDDIISMMWGVRIDGKPMTLDIMQKYGLSLFLGGLDTVMNAIMHGTRHLAMNPALQAELRANPRRIPQMTDEMIRLYSFVMPMRRVARDAVFEGVQMKEGERVHFYLAGAGRDPQQFEKPDMFVSDRETKTHAGFGAGPHRCIGMHIARVELHVYYEELLSRLPSFRLNPDHPPFYHGGIVTGPNHLHLLWD